jgi:hypothetical protein
MHELVAALAGVQPLRAVPAGDVGNERECLQLAAAILNGVCVTATQREHVQLQVTECRVTAESPLWLHCGDYMRFAFRVGTQGGLLERLQTVFERLRLPLPGEVQENKVLWERMNPARTVSLGISVCLPAELRLVLWLPGRPDSGAAADTPPTAARKS